MKTSNITRIAGVAISATALFGVCVAPASAVNNIKGYGAQETLKDFYSLGDFSSEIGYTVKNLRPSRDPVPYPVAGRLYEANVTADAVVGTVSPQTVNRRLPSRRPRAAPSSRCPSRDLRFADVLSHFSCKTSISSSCRWGVAPLPA